MITHFHTYLKKKKKKILHLILSIMGMMSGLGTIEEQHFLYNTSIKYNTIRRKLEVNTGIFLRTKWRNMICQQ